MECAGKDVGRSIALPRTHFLRHRNPLKVFPVTKVFLARQFPWWKRVEASPATRGFRAGAAGLTNSARAETMEKLHPPASGPVAQLGARFHGMEEVIGSIPIRSTNKSCRFIYLTYTSDSFRLAD